MLLIVRQDIVNTTHFNQLWSVSLPTSLISSVGLRVSSSEESWFYSENILASWNKHVFCLGLGGNDNTILVIQVSVTNDEHLIFSIVLY